MAYSKDPISDNTPAEAAVTTTPSSPQADTVSYTAPYYRTTDTASSVTIDKIIALLPLLVWATYLFGLRVLTVASLSVFGTVLCDLTLKYFTCGKRLYFDWYTLLYGILFTCLLPAAVPLWIPFFGGAAIVLFCFLFGGSCKTPIHPVLAVFTAYLSVYPSAMTEYTKPYHLLSLFSNGFPFDALEQTDLLTALSLGELPNISRMDLFFGIRSGSIGEVSVLLILCGFIYLVCRRALSWKIPTVYVGVCALLFFLFPKTILTTDGIMLKYASMQLMSGMLLFVSVYFASEGSFAPATEIGRIVFAVLCGLVTFAVRHFSVGADGAVVAVMLAELLRLVIDVLVMPRPFGRKRALKGEDVK